MKLVLSRNIVGALQRFVKVLWFRHHPLLLSSHYFLLLTHSFICSICCCRCKRFRNLFALTLREWFTCWLHVSSLWRRMLFALFLFLSRSHLHETSKAFQVSVLPNTSQNANANDNDTIKASYSGHNFVYFAEQCLFYTYIIRRWLLVSPSFQ